MKRFRWKVVGLGLSLAAGSALAADGDWRAPGQPAAAVEVAPTGAPGLLPPSLRAGSAKLDAPIWVPARQSAAAPVAPLLIMPAGGGIPDAGFVAPPVQPVPQPAPQPQQQPEPQPVPMMVGPRGVSDLGPLPAIPALPDEAPEPPRAPASAPIAAQPDPIPQPRAVDPKPVEVPLMPPPRVPEFLPQWKGDPLPLPRPLETPSLPLPRPEGGELQPAPAGLMIPTGALEVGGKHTLFGSQPLRLSRDYPPLRDLIHNGHEHSDITIVGDAVDGGPMSRFFVRGEFLLWWMPGFATPVLATTNPNTALNGYLGEPGTASILGPGGFVGSTRSGLRLRAGAWLDDCGSCGLDGGFFFLGRKSAASAFNSDQYPLITRPVFVANVFPGATGPLGENGEAVAVPGILRGSLTARADSQLWGADVNVRKNLLNRCDVRAEVFAGYRHLNLRESLTITEDITVIGPGGDRVVLTDPIGTRVVVQDRFATRNSFNGGQIGGLYERRMGRWEWDARGSIALGSTHQALDIDGFQVRQQPGADPMTFRGGLLAAGPNLGHFSRDRFSVAPEFTLNLGYYVTPHLRVFAGYNFLLWTNVIRPGDQIDHTIDLTFVPNALPANFSGQYRPRPLFKQSDLVVNGVQFGLDWRW